VRASLAPFLGSSPVEAPTQPITGPVVADGRNWSDVTPTGLVPRLRLGVTWFWGAWARDNDLPRFDRNAAWLAKQGNYAPRMFGYVVNGGNYVHRQVTQSGLMRAMTRLRDTYQRRSLPVILGDCSDLSDSQKTDQVNLFCDLMYADPSLANAVLLAEIGNEGGHTGLQNIDLLARLYAIARNRLPSMLCAPTSAEDYPWPDESGGQITDLYQRTGGRVLSMHPSRGGDANAIIRQTYGYNFLGLPQLGADTEPWGPSSSVAWSTSFEENAATALVCWISGYGLYVFHCGTGVYGIRQDTPYGPRYENFDEDPAVVAILPQLETLRASLPQDLSNFGRPHHADPKNNGLFPFITEPFTAWDKEFRETGMRAYANVSNDGRFVIGLVGQQREFVITPRNSMTFTVRRMNWQPLDATRTLAHGAPYTLHVPPFGYGIIEGRFI
jgi:hypothetical protein